MKNVFKYKLTVLWVLTVFQFIKKIWLQDGMSATLYELTDTGYCFRVE